MGSNRITMRLRAYSSWLARYIGPLGTVTFIIATIAISGWLLVNFAKLGLAAWLFTRSNADASSLASRIAARESERAGRALIDLFRDGVEDDINKRMIDYLGYSNAYEGDRQTLENQYSADRLIAREPAPALDYSLDRMVLAQRLVALGEVEKVSHLYLILNNGTWLHLKILGRPVSLSKSLTPPSGDRSTSLPDQSGLYGAGSASTAVMTAAGSLLEFGGVVGYIHSENELLLEGQVQGVFVNVELVLSDSERVDLLNRLLDMRMRLENYRGSGNFRDGVDTLLRQFSSQE